MADEKPEGITPRKEHDERRANEIHQAVNRYVDAGLPIPIVWIEEYRDIANREHGLSVFDNFFKERPWTSVKSLRKP